MKVIHKFKLDSDGSQTAIKLKEGYRIVHSEYVLVDKAICIWVEQSLAVDLNDKEVLFKVVRSGEPISDTWQHVSSAVDNLAPEAYHIITPLVQNLEVIDGMYRNYNPLSQTA